ncbi:MAG TPA: FtsL-like putative cell division protein [Flavobacteriales bacterium]|nr:FtsL-like putative cell division protein [Flavobacteriales bacterium]
MNRYKKAEEAKPKKTKAPRKPSKFGRSLIDVLNGNMLTRDFVISNLPYICFLTILMLTYIGLGYYADRNARKIEQIEADLVELNSEHVSLKTQLNMVSNPAQIADSTRSMGLVESRDFPPRIIYVKEKVLKTVY